MVLEKILPAQSEQAYPVCLEGERNCPQEDCGGVWGHQRILEILADETHPEYDETIDWLKTGYDPESFELEKVNKRLQQKARQLNPQTTQKKELPKKPVKLTPAKLKKQLQSLSHPELIQLLVECFTTSKQTEQFLTVKLMGEEAIEALFAVYRKKVKDEFFPDKGFGKLRLAEAKKAIDEFQKITQSKKYTLELKLLYVEMGVEFTNTYGDIDARFYESILKMFASVVEMINEVESYDLFEEYEERIAQVVAKSTGIGWGFSDSMQEIYAEVKWL